MKKTDINQHEITHHAPLSREIVSALVKNIEESKATLQQGKTMLNCIRGLFKIDTDPRSDLYLPPDINLYRSQQGIDAQRRCSMAISNLQLEAEPETDKLEADLKKAAQHVAEARENIRINGMRNHSIESQADSIFLQSKLAKALQEYGKLERLYLNAMG